MVIRKAKGKDLLYTSFTSHTIRASVNELKKVLGKPHYDERDENEKSQVEWDFVIEGEGSVFSIYDWKEYRIYSDDEVIEWHIGGVVSSCGNNKNHTDIALVIKELKALGLAVM